MWKARYEAERAAERERAAWRADHEAQQAHRNAAWEEYKEHWLMGLTAERLRPWWHLRSWFRVIFGK